MTLKSCNDTSGLYHGMSMKRVFVPGERLFLEARDPATFVCGDVVVITYPDRESVVHRVIRTWDGGLQTMGDNNALADKPVKFNGEHHFYLVTGAEDLQGRRRDVVNGPEGMRLFHRNQRKRKCRSFASRILWSFEQLFFWRKKLDQVHTFGSETVIYHGDTPIARRLPDGRAVYLKWTYRLRYKV